MIGGKRSEYAELIATKANLEARNRSLPLLAGVDNT